MQAELRSRDSPEARRWAQGLQPLADRVARAYLDFLPRQTYPIRTGVHPNTAFGLSLALDYAQVAQEAKLQGLIAERGPHLLRQGHAGAAQVGAGRRGLPFAFAGGGGA